MPKNIKEIFTSWGKEKRELPERNEILKNDMLNHFAALPKTRISVVQRIPWLAVSFAALAFIVLVAKPSSDKAVTTSQNVSYIEPNVAGVESDQSLKIAPEVYPPIYRDNTPITDDREFMKANYSAEISTRVVKTLAKKIQNAIHAFDGRIDSISISEKYGQISFVMPASKFDAFQTELNSFVSSKFISENLNAYNVLPQKVNVENQITETNKQLEDLRTQPRNITRDEKIKRLELELDRLTKENQMIVDNVATVTGNISIKWVSIWNIFTMYFSRYYLAALLAIAALWMYLRKPKMKLDV